MKQVAVKNLKNVVRIFCLKQIIKQRLIKDFLKETR